MLPILALPKTSQINNISILAHVSVHVKQTKPLTHGINKVDDLEDPLSHFDGITVHLLVLWCHKLVL